MGYEPAWPLCPLGMLGQALALILLLLPKRYQGQEFLDSAVHVVGLSGNSLQLLPLRMQTEANSVEWKVQLPSKPGFYRILSWKNSSTKIYYENWILKDFKNRFTFTIENLTLLIKAAQQQNSGLYILEVTDSSGKVWRKQFQVSVFDHVEKPRLQHKVKAVDRGMCQAVLNCSVSGGGNVTYAWYRGSELICSSTNLTYLEQQIDVNGSHTFTCNVSNPVSWASDTLTLTLTQDCQSAYQKSIPLLYLVITMILLLALFLGTLSCFCVWRRKRKQSQASPAEFLTIYEDVNNLQIKRNQEQQQNSSREGNTIYSMIQSRSQPSASTSQETANTLYSLVQPSRKSGSKKNHNPPLSCTIYEEVGKSQRKAQNPARLSRKELENFCAYS